jgi:hypothetical protein
MLNAQGFAPAVRCFPPGIGLASGDRDDQLLSA